MAVAMISLQRPAPFGAAPGASNTPAGCEPVPPSASVIHLPKDQYLHLGAPTEWWWHTGTLLAGDRVFGFEINAASFTVVGFTQVMLTDVASGRHLQNTVLYEPPGFDPKTWAQSDPTQPWSAQLGDTSSNAYVSMRAPAPADPTQNMAIQASMQDQDDPSQVVRFDLTMSQQGAPFIVWGTGVQPPGGTGGDYDKYNYYYSLTRLQASGTITVQDQTVQVSGTTWMDHEYGLFGSAAHPVKWILQDMQLSNGVCVSNYTTESAPVYGQPNKSFATVQTADGTMYFVESTVTPHGRTWKSAKTGKTYFMQLSVEIPCFGATLEVESLVDGQEFPGPTGVTSSPVYEGVAKASGTFKGAAVTGTAWNEQALA